MHKVVICSFFHRSTKMSFYFITFFLSPSLSLSLFSLLYRVGQFGASIVALCPKNVGLHSNPAFMLCKPEFQPNNTTGATVMTTKPTEASLVVPPPTLLIPTIQPPSAVTTSTIPSPTKLTNSNTIQSTDKAAIVEAKKGTDEKCFL